MFKLRFLVAAAAAALALGGASALAMQQNSSSHEHPDNHGAVVSSAARTTCHTVDSGTHGQCVSAIASTNGQAHRKGAGSDKVQACKAQGLTGARLRRLRVGTREEGQVTVLGFDRGTRSRSPRG